MTTIRLENGQVWQQMSDVVSSDLVFNPAVIIFRHMGQYRMKVEGTRGTVVVKQIQSSNLLRH